MYCRLPTGVHSTAPATHCTAARWDDIAQESRENTDAALSPTPSGVALIATPKGPLASDPSCTVITVPKTSHHSLCERGWGGCKAGGVAASAGLAF